jgi:hypothetical protein
MGLKAHPFAPSLRRGQLAEEWLDRVFERDYEIRPASEGEQRRGIDRWFRRLAARRVVPVEYQTDWRASETGRALVETVAVDDGERPPKPGWAYSSRAVVLVYYVPGDDLIYLLTMARVRHHLRRWMAEYGPEVEVANEGYVTKGVCVPLHEFETLALEKINLADYPDLPPVPDWQAA